MFKGEDDDFEGQNESQGVAIGNQMINKASIMGEITSRMEDLQTGSATTTGAAPTGDARGEVNMEAERTIKDIIEERQEELKDLEQLQDMKSTNFVEALTTDIESKVAISTGPVLTETPSAKGAEKPSEGN